MIDTDIAPNERGYYEQLCVEWFQHPHIQPDVTLVGVQTVNKTRYLGCRAGPGISVSNLAHEMGHFVECPRENLLQLAWGMRTREKELLGCIYPEPLTHQDTQREIRTLVIQAKILATLEGYDVTTAAIKAAKSFAWFAGRVNVPEITDRSTFSGHFSGHFGRWSKDESRLEWVWREFETLYAVADINQIRGIWGLRTVMLKEALA